MKPIQGPIRQTIGFPEQDASQKDASYVQTPEPLPKSPERSQASKNQSIGEARLLGDLRAGELNASYQHNQTDLEFLRSRSSKKEAGKIEYPNVVFSHPPENASDASFKGEIVGIEPTVKSRENSFNLPEVDDEVLMKKDTK